VAIWSKLHSTPKAFFVKLVGERMDSTLALPGFSSNICEAVVDILLGGDGVAILADVSSDISRNNTGVRKIAECRSIFIR
jgi:hypothetical protein